MTIGTPLALGSANAASGSLTLALTTTADSPAGATIVVFIASGNTATINSVTDSAGNTYTAGNSLSSGSTKQNIYWCIGALHLPAGGTITGAWAASTGSKMLGAMSVSGILSVDQQPTGTSGTGTSPSITSATLGQAGEIVFAQVTIASGAGDGFTPAPGFTVGGSASNGAAMRWSYKASLDLGAVTYAPTLGTSRNWGAKLIAFKGEITINPTINVVGGVSAANTASPSFSVTGAAPLGSAIVAFVANEGGILPVSLTDSAGNVYLAGDRRSGTGYAIDSFVCVNALALPIGGTITPTWDAASTQRKFLAAIAVTGVASIEGAAVGNKGTSDSPTAQLGGISTGAAIVYAAAFRSGGASGVFTDDVNFATDQTVLNNSALYVSEFAAKDQSAVYYGPGFDASADWATQIVALLGQNPGPPSLCAVPGLDPPTVDIQFGYQQSPTSLGLITCALLGVKEYRIGINNTLDYSAPTTPDAIDLLATVAACNAAGVKIIPDIKNNPPGLPGGYSGTAPADLGAYAQQLNDILDILGDQVAMVCIENEVNGNYVPVGTLPAAGGDYATYYAAVKQVVDDTAAAYFGQLRTAGEVCAARGVPVTHSGVSDTGITRAYALALIASGDLASATQFINTTSRGNKGIIANDLPNLDNPDRPVFANNPDALYGALLSTTLIEQGAANGAQFMNAHVFWSLPDICWEYKAIAWARDTSGLALVLTATGQKTADPAATMAITQLMRLLQPVRMSFFGALNSARAFSYANADGSLTAIGVIVRTAIAAYRNALNPPATRFGIFCSGPEYLRLGRNLGVQYQRLTVNNTIGPMIGAASAAAIREEGMGINLILNNASVIPSVPPADIPLYQSQLAAILDNIKPDLVNIQIEIDAGVFYQPQATPAATAAAYLAQLTAAADVCHSTGAYAGQNRQYPIGDSGISSSGTNFAYWNYLWGLGDHGPGNAADVFKAVAFVGPSQGTDGTDARDQVPDADHPTRGIFASAGQADRLRQLTLVGLLLAGLRATGIDYINIHAFWYFEDFTQKRKAIQWVIDQVGMPAMTNAWGQRDRDPQTTRAMYAGARELQMNWLFWYSVFQKKAQDPGDQDGDLTILGTALRDAANPHAWRIGHSARTPLVFTGRSAGGIA